MYSPKIKEEYIPTLYKIAKVKDVPMTRVVNEALADYLSRPNVKFYLSIFNRDKEEENK